MQTPKKKMRVQTTKNVTVTNKNSNKLTNAELKALSHQKRGMPAMSDAGEFFVKKSGPIKNELGILTPSQTSQLKKYMAKAPASRKIYEALPNVGRIFGSSAADIPKNSKLQKQRKGGSVKKTTKSKKK